MMLFHTTEKLWKRPFATWTGEEIAEAIIEVEDESRMDSFGGYPSDYLLQNDMVYIATVDGYSGKPDLTVSTIADFIKDNDCWVEVIKEQLEAAA